MGKFILFSLNLIFLVAYNFFFGGDVVITQDIPSSVKAGQKFKIEVEIEKGEREGFAKWQQQLPEGFIATASETAGATFSFKKNTVKLIWMALPESESFTISYEVQPDPSINGEFEVVGKFSYIEENERKDIETEAAVIKIGKGGPALAAKTEEMPKEESKMEESSSMVEEMPEKKAETMPVQAAATTTMASKSSSAGLELREVITSNEDIKVERSIKVLDNGEYQVSLIIDKQNFESFGKVEEYVPRGYIASEMQSNQGIFSFNNNLVKILWMALPPESTIEVSYKLQSQSDELDSATVHGVFSFLKGEESVQLGMRGMTFPNTYGASPQMAMEEEEEEKEETAMVAADPVPDNKPTPSEKKETVKEITSVPAPETSVSYRVQIAAGKKEVQQAYFKQRHGIVENVTIDYHNTWYKYMIGSFGVYKEARDKRNDVWAADNKIDDAFVTAYNSGERITVQEALMITKQKWYK